MPHGLMSELNDHAVDLRQDIVVQKGDVVRQPIKVDVQTLLHHGKYQDLPEVHARPAVRAVDRFTVRLLNERQDVIPGLGLAPQRLQRVTEHLGIVPGLRVEGELLDRGGAERGLRIKGLSHKVPPVFSLGALEMLRLAKICGFRTNLVC